jgi:hypothetical protein
MPPPHDGAARVHDGIEGAEDFGWPEPEMAVLRLHRRPPPVLPLELFGPGWAQWIAEAAEAAACPPDYVAMPLFASASTLIGNARWAQATPGWAEPPHLWAASVGDSGTGKSPGSDALFRDILPELERRLAADFPDQLGLWRAASEIATAVEKKWKEEVAAAIKAGRAPPAAPGHPQIGSEPQAPRLRQNDVTVEKVALVLAKAAPKGVLIVRDELAGWILGMANYNAAGRAFWIEAYGGRPYTQDRVKHPEPIVIPRLAVATYGGVQPDRVSEMMRTGDDGLLARFLWAWPDPIPFRLARRAPRIGWAIEALDRLRWLDLQTGDPPYPIKVPLVAEALPLLEEFARDMQQRQIAAGGLLRSALGKVRGLLLRLSLVLEMLWWCGSSGAEAAPAEISMKAFAAAAALLDRYFVPMAERVYGDAALSDGDRHAATVARWILQKRPTLINAREVRRNARLPGLSVPENVRLALAALVEADWIIPAPKSGGISGGRPRDDYIVNPRVFEESLHVGN